MATVTHNYNHDVVTFEDEENVRYIVAHDDLADDPRGDWDGVQLLPYNVPCFGIDSEISETVAESGTMRTFARVYDATGDDEHALTVAKRYARIFEPAAEIVTRTVRGYVQSDWADIVCVVESPGYGDAEGYVEEWEQYFRGDVYVVWAEYEKTWHDNNGQTMTTWERENDHGIESLPIGGFYAESVEDAADEYATSYM